jgi:deoxyribonuclease-4
MIGIHIDSTPDDIIKSATHAKNKGANIIQFFVNTSLKNTNIYDKLRKLLVKNKMNCVVHASYTINLAQNWDKYSIHIQQFINEIKLAENINAKYIVIHLGKKLNLSREESINNMYSSLLYIYQEIKDLNIKILIETSAGQGTEMGYKLDEFAILYRKFSKHLNKKVSNKFGICLDTCHVFSAGYDITSKNARDIFLDNFNELLGLEHIKLIHLNDSKVPINSNVDRHQNFGEGYIGKESLVIFANIFKKKNIPIIIETGYPKIYEDLKCIL